MLFGIEKQLNVKTVDEIYDQISEKVMSDTFRPRALYDIFSMEAISTNDACADNLEYHQRIVKDNWQGQVVQTYLPKLPIIFNFNESNLTLNDKYN